MLPLTETSIIDACAAFEQATPGLNIGLRVASNLAKRAEAIEASPNRLISVLGVTVDPSLPNGEWRITFQPPATPRQKR